MLYLVRHAKASSGRLTGVGLDQADRLAKALAERPLDRIVCSPKRRCRDTMAPLADLTGLTVATLDDLGEHADIEPAWALLESLAGDDAVVCSHAPVIEAVLNRLHRRDGELVADEWSCRPASVWQLDADLTRAVLEARQP